MEMNDILKKFIRAERLGDWKMHLSALSDMWPYFVAHVGPIIMPNQAIFTCSECVNCQKIIKCLSMKSS